MKVRSLSSCFVSLACLGLLACGSAKPSQPNEAPTTGFPELEAKLQQEFQRLGIDPAKAAAAAPSGAENAVFDLSASLVDPDGPPDGLGGGELPPTGIQLKWTERHQGDYDGNGIVAVNDLTPIGLQFQNNVSYDAPALHGGLSYFPAGDPDDASGGAGSGAANWALARVDGNADGKITVQDLTPIAVHYQQRIYGYRVYLKAPSDSGFVLQDSFSGPPPSPGGEDSYVTVKHPASVPAAQPVRYDYENSPDGGGSGEFEAGVYQFFVTSWDSVSNTEGQRSPTLSIDIETGEVNQGPVANLTVSPDFAGAPAVITLDATQSVDFDGSIAEYRWDLDGDGTVDYSSLDPEPPEMSSSGKVVEIAPGDSSAELTARFIQGSEAYYLPTVRAVDNEGLLSAAASDQLGISGWVKEFITSDAEPVLDLEYIHFAYNPIKQRVIAYGTRNIGTGEDINQGFFYAERLGPEDWTPLQLCFDETDSDYQVWLDGANGSYFTQSIFDPAFDDDGDFFLPNIVQKGSLSIKEVVFAIVQDGDTWDYRPLYFPSDGGSTGTVFTPVLLENSRFAIVVQNKGANNDYSVSVMEYDTESGASALDDPLWVRNVDPPSRLPTDMVMAPDGRLTLPLRGDSTEIPMLTRIGSNDYQESSYSIGQFNLSWNQYVLPKLHYSAAGSPFFHVDEVPYNDLVTAYVLGDIFGSSQSFNVLAGFDFFAPVTVDPLGAGTDTSLLDGAGALTVEYSVWAFDRTTSIAELYAKAGCKRYEPSGAVISEDWVTLLDAHDLFVSGLLGIGPDGREIGFLGGELPEFNDPQEPQEHLKGYSLMHRVDPRN